MKQKEKCVEYYFDSNQYNKDKVIENMEKKQLEFEKRKSEIDIKLNEYGIYVAKLIFQNKELTVINNKIISKFINKSKIVKKSESKNTYKGYEMYNENNKIYGQYKKTKTYQPI